MHALEPDKSFNMYGNLSKIKVCFDNLFYVPTEEMVSQQWQIDIYINNSNNNK